MDTNCAKLAAVPPPWERAFLAAYARTGNITVACRCANISRRTVYYAREQRADFAEALNAAREEAADLLEEEALRRAYHGADEPVIHLGKQCFTWVDADGKPVPEGAEGATQIPLIVKKYDSTLLIFLLKAARPYKYRETYRLEHANADAQIAEQIARLLRSNEPPALDGPENNGTSPEIP